MRKLYGTITSIEECYSECGMFTITVLITEKFILYYPAKVTVTTLKIKSNLPWLTIISK